MWRSDWRGRDIYFNSTHVGMAVQVRPTFIWAVM